MISMKQYDGITFHDLIPLFQKVNIKFYENISSIGCELNLKNKDQQKIYTHYFLKEVCELIKICNETPIFYINEFSICDIHKKIIKKIKTIFGIKVWMTPLPFSTFIVKLKERNVEWVDTFELFLQKESKPKSFRHIKKYLEKEGMINLSDSYFQDIANKMAIMC